MPVELNEHERLYLARGYRLPTGWTWSAVHAMRSIMRSSETSVPLVVVDHGAIWGRHERRRKPRVAYPA